MSFSQSEKDIIEATSQDPLIAKVITEIEEESRDAYVHTAPGSYKASQEETSKYSSFVASEALDQKEK